MTPRRAIRSRPRTRFAFDDVQHVFQRQRLKVEPVAGVIVGAHRLRVAVDHDRLIAQLLQGKAGVAAAVVEFDALADAIGSAAQDDDLAPVAGLRLVVVLVAAVQIGRIGLEFGRAGIHQVVGGEHAQLLAQAAHVSRSVGAPAGRRLTAARCRQLAVAKPCAWPGAGCRRPGLAPTMPFSRATISPICATNQGSKPVIGRLVAWLSPCASAS